MSTRYFGVVVGGPLARSHASCVSPTMQTVDAGTRPRVLSELEATSARFAKFQYRHHEVHMQGSSMGVWIPGDKSPEWAMQELVNAYTGAKQ